MENPATEPIALVLLFFFALGLYFLPSFVAIGRKHHQENAIILLNMLLGWTLLGWIAALVWAATAVRKDVS